MKKEQEQTICQCYHCGNKGLMNVISIQKEKFGGSFVNADGVLDNDLEENFIWYTLSCPVCHFITLMQKYTNESYYDPSTDELNYDEEILYPENKMKMQGVPKSIESSFESALKIKNIDSNICLISLRRTLEMICNDKHAEGNNLYKKIKYLIQEKIFPEELENAYLVIKDFGNDGAHGGNIHLYGYEIDELIKLLYDVINYLYIMPKKMENMKQRLDVKKAINKGSEINE